MEQAQLDAAFEDFRSLLGLVVRQKVCSIVVSECEQSSNAGVVSLSGPNGQWSYHLALSTLSRASSWFFKFQRSASLCYLFHGYPRRVEISTQTLGTLVWNGTSDGVLGVSSWSLRQLHVDCAAALNANIPSLLHNGSRVAFLAVVVFQSYEILAPGDDLLIPEVVSSISWRCIGLQNVGQPVTERYGFAFPLLNLDPEFVHNITIVLRSPPTSHKVVKEVISDAAVQCLSANVDLLSRACGAQRAIGAPRLAMVRHIVDSVHRIVARSSNADFVRQAYEMLGLNADCTSGQLKYELERRALTHSYNSSQFKA